MFRKWCLVISIMCLFMAGTGMLAKPAPCATEKWLIDLTCPGSVLSAQPMTDARAAHTATLLQDGRVLVAGGIQRDGVYLSSAELYNPVTAIFTNAGEMTTPRASHTATLLPTGKVLLVGGWARQMLTSAEIYDPATGSFTATGSMQAARNAFTATLLNNGKVLIAGLSASGSSSELYDPVSGTFSPSGEMDTARSYHTATLLADRRVLITGGLDEEGVVLATAEIYDPDTETFIPTPDHMTAARHKQGAALLADGRVLIVGGADERDWEGRLSSAEIYDPTNGLFLPTKGSLDTGRFKLSDALVMLPGGNVLVAGAGEQPQVYVTVMGRFAATKGALDAARFVATATLLNDGSVLIAGGYDYGISATTGTWLYRS